MIENKHDEDKKFYTLVVKFMRVKRDEMRD